MEANKGKNTLPCLDDLMFLIVVYNSCNLSARIVEEITRLAGLSINWDKSDNKPLHGRLHLGFVVDLAEGLVKVPAAR